MDPDLPGTPVQRSSIGTAARHLELIVLIPPPPPAFTLSPSLAELSREDLAAVERCVASLSGQMGGVVVTGFRVRGRHRVVEVETLMGTVIIQEAVEAGEAAHATR